MQNDDEFAAKVEERHGDNRHGKAYKAAIEYVKAVMVKGDNNATD